MDNLTKLQRSENMKRIRSAGTGFEKSIFGALRKRGICFQTHYKNVIGKPDIALPRSKRAVFLHSDFWHGWQLSKWINTLPNKFWKTKLTKNRARDEKVIRSLRKQGWKVTILWEHTFYKYPNQSIDKIERFLKLSSL
jgi:DNA mismatch endonuclease, patch repair protein